MSDLRRLLCAYLAWLAPLSAAAEPPDAGPPPAAPASVETAGITPEDLEIVRQMELLRSLGLLQKMHLFIEVEPPEAPK